MTTGLKAAAEELQNQTVEWFKFDGERFLRCDKSGKTIEKPPVKDLRDEMAMAALPVVATALEDYISRIEVEPNESDDEALRIVAKWSYKLSDAMLEARKKGGAS